MAWLTAAGRVLGELTAHSAVSRYGRAVWEWRGPLAAGDRIAVRDVGQARGDAYSDGEVLWADGLWAVVCVPDWGDEIGAIHLDSGRVYQLEDATDGTVIGIRSYLPETINPETVHVRGTIRDWTGRTIGLIAL